MQKGGELHKAEQNLEQNFQNWSRISGIRELAEFI